MAGQGHQEVEHGDQVLVVDVVHIPLDTVLYYLEFRVHLEMRVSKAGIPSGKHQT